MKAINALSSSPRENQKIITVKEARKILGIKSDALSDTQIEEIILSLQGIAKEQLMYNGSKNT